MGLTLHFHGRIKSANHLNQLIEEIADVCRTMDWSFGIIDRVLDGVPEDYVNLLGPDAAGGFRARGISFSVHPAAETTTLCCGPDGLTLSPMALHRSDLTDWSDDMLAHHSFTKTQAAGAEAHMVLCRFLAYLSTKYFNYLEVHDEGGFYHSQDEARLRHHFRTYASAVSTLPVPTGRVGAVRTISVPELLDLLAKTFPDADIRLLGDLEEE